MILLDISLFFLDSLNPVSVSGVSFSILRRKSCSWWRLGVQYQLREEGGINPSQEVSTRSSCRRKRAAAVSGGLQLRRLQQEASPGGGQAAAGQDDQHEGPGAGKLQFAT